MSGPVRVTATAQEQIALIDAALKEELIRQVVAISDDPREWLHAPLDPLFSRWREASYASEAVPGIRIALYFSGVDSDPPGLTLEFLTHVRESDDTEAP